MPDPVTSKFREVSLGARPKGEREAIPPGDPSYGDIALMDALTFRRYLDRVFWHPRSEVLRFEVRAVPSLRGRTYDVVALVAPGEGEVWFSEQAVPARWDYVAITEINYGLSKRLRSELRAAGKIPDDYQAFDDGPLPDFSNLENPEEVAQRRWAVVHRLREASRRARNAAKLG
ncbi:hypothetical protein [Cupriavidus sp. a3]|uniref:hypothetical protein n=1 Tax=Cupriavidus sp. a3 TaxID=3242158 RepID=UPI003D9C664C